MLQEFTVKFKVGHAADCGELMTSRSCLWNPSPRGWGSAGNSMLWIHCVSVASNIFRCNSSMHRWILTIFGKNVWQKVQNWKTVISHHTWLMFLHYPAKLETQKLHLFAGNNVVRCSANKRRRLSEDSWRHFCLTVLIISQVDSYRDIDSCVTILPSLPK